MPSDGCDPGRDGLPAAALRAAIDDLCAAWQDFGAQIERRVAGHPSEAGEADQRRRQAERRLRSAVRDLTATL